MSIFQAEVHPLTERTDASKIGREQLRDESLLMKERCANNEQERHEKCADSMVLDKLCNIFGDDGDDLAPPSPVGRQNSVSSVNSLSLPFLDGVDENFFLMQDLHDANGYEDFSMDMNDLQNCGRSLSGGWQSIGTPRSVSLAPSENQDVDTENRDSNIETCQESVVRPECKYERLQSCADDDPKKRRVPASPANPPFDSMEFLPIVSDETVGTSPPASLLPIYEVEDTPSSSGTSQTVSLAPSSVSSPAPPSPPICSNSSLLTPSSSGKLVLTPLPERLVAVPNGQEKPNSSSTVLMGTPKKVNKWWDAVDPVLTPEQSKKHQAWPATKAKRVKYGRKFVYENKRNIAISRKRKDGKFEPRTEVRKKKASAKARS